ncbi:hypothetical protein ACFQ3J_09305 [Paenibacillus provencensis]|uniref:YcxB-like protein n=1 Tax=Paenibacillus provencensis TaxID=441151 RepID=A0ABW3PTW8_9BACL|nr:hypothetical protein [Paenibacillus sp. MER 78]MCM3128914.1 hypothetical protein [Paenibacillus sp. MER 78]
MFNYKPEFVVSHRKRVRTLVIFGAATLFMGLLNLSQYRELVSIPFILYSAVFAFEIIILVIQLSKKPKLFKLVNNSLQIGDRTYNPEDIKSIIIEEAYGPTIAIKPKGRWIVPVMNVYRVTESADADDVFETIHEWGDKCNVPVLTKRIWTL